MRATTRLKTETWIIVSLITVLIWLLAEGRTVESHRSVLSVRLVAPPGQTLRIEPAEVQHLEMFYRSAAAQRVQVENLALPLEIEVTAGADPRETRHLVNLRERLLADTPIGELGIDVQRIEPNAIEARVQRLESLEMPIHVNTGQLWLAEPPRVEPERVSVVLPSGRVEQARSLAAEASLITLDPSGLQAGQTYTREVPLQLPPPLRGGTTQMTPTRAKVTFTVRSTHETHTLATVPVLLVAPPTELSRFRVELEDEDRLLRDVVVAGPSDVIERIRSGQTEVWARFRLSADDLESGVTSAPVTVDLPPGVTIESTLPRVSFTITRLE